MLLGLLLNPPNSAREFLGRTFPSGALPTLHLCLEFPPRFPSVVEMPARVHCIHSEMFVRDSAAESSTRLLFAANILGEYHQNWSVPAQVFGSSLEPELCVTALWRNRLCSHPWLQCSWEKEGPGQALPLSCIPFSLAVMVSWDLNRSRTGWKNQNRPLSRAL